MTTKVCGKCGEEKDVEMFGKDKSRKDGLKGSCKKCLQEDGKRYREENVDKRKESLNKYCENNKEKVREYRKKYKKNNIDKIKESSKKYREENKDKAKEYYAKRRVEKGFISKEVIIASEGMKFCSTCGEELPIDMFGKYINAVDGLKSRCNSCRQESGKKYYAENKEIISEKTAKYREENVAKFREHRKKYYEKNKDTIKEYHKKYREENKDRTSILTQRRRAKKRNLPHTLTVEQWKQAKLHFNNSCCYCGKELPLAREHFIAQDNGGGYTKENIVSSCGSCNSSKINHDFFEWYPTHKSFNKDRQLKILKYLNYDENNMQQIALAIR